MEKQLDVDGTEMVAGQFYIVKDKQERVGPDGLLVIRQGDGSLAGDTVQLGIFWQPDMAKKFLDALIPKRTR